MTAPPRVLNRAERAITMIRVGRCRYEKGKRVDPCYPGYRVIVVLTKGTNRWGMLGPYELADEQGRIMENVWQFSKVYPRVERVRQAKSRFEPVVVWDHPAETHLRDAGAPPTPDNLTPEYWAWRQKGMDAPYAVRYPPGFGAMSQCVGLLAETEGGYAGPLGYVDARKALYVPLYCRLARRSPLLAELRAAYLRGARLLIAEVDGPHQESLAHYQQAHGVGPDFIERDTVVANEANLRVLLNDPLHPFGHGYCLAAAILGIDVALCAEAAPGAAPGAAPEAAPGAAPEAATIPDDDALWDDLGL